MRDVWWNVFIYFFFVILSYINIIHTNNAWKTLKALTFHGNETHNDTHPFHDSIHTCIEESSYDISFVTVVYRKCLSTYDSGNKDIHDMTIGVFCSKLFRMIQNCQETFRSTICKYYASFDVVASVVYILYTQNEHSQTIEGGWFLAVSSNFVYNEWWIFLWCSVGVG